MSLNLSRCLWLSLRSPTDDVKARSISKLELESNAQSSSKSNCLAAGDASMTRNDCHEYLQSSIPRLFPFLDAFSLFMPCFHVLPHFLPRNHSPSPSLCYIPVYWEAYSIVICIFVTANAMPFPKKKASVQHHINFKTFAALE